MLAIRRSTILADARARHSALSRLPHLSEVVLRADDPRVERVLSVVHVGAASTGVEASLADAKTVEDVDAVYRDYLARGAVPGYVKTDDWVGRQITGGGHTLDVLVLSDYGSIVGPDGVPFRIGKSSQGLAQEYADAFYSILPSEKLLTDLENSADVKIGFIPVQKSGGGADDSVEAVIIANDKAIAALDKVGATESDGLLKIGFRKAYVTRPNLDGSYIAIHGGRWSAAGGLVQPTSGHAHTEPSAANDWTYSDYSHGIVLVSRKAKLDGVDVDLRTDVFGSDDPEIWGLVNGERVKFDPVFPNAGASSAAKFSVGSMSGSDESGGGGGGGGGVDTTVSPTPGTSGGATSPGDGAPTAGLSGSAGGLKQKFSTLSTPSKVGVVALVLLVGGGIAWAVI